MAGITVNEGLAYIAGVIYAGDSAETYNIGLMTNAAGTLSVTSQWSDITQPSGDGYSETALTGGSFVIAADGTVTYPQVQWTANDNWTGGDITGFYIRHTNVSPKLIHFQYRDSGSFQMTTGRIYTVDLAVDTS